MLVGGAAVRAQNVNDATRPSSATIFDASRGLNFNELIRASEELQNSQDQVSPDQRNQSLDQAIQRFNQSRQLQIGPSILASPSPSPDAATPSGIPSPSGSPDPSPTPSPNP